MSTSTKSAYKACPKCKNGKLDTRTKRGVFIKALLFWLPLQRYRCSNCNQKSYIMVKSGQ